MRGVAEGWAPYWKHLRVPFQLSLAPLFLWGYFLAHPASHEKLLPAFLAFHLFLYTGITAFNSAYDRDEGPVGGMLRPPAVPPGLLRLSLAVQALGTVPAAFVGPLFLAIYLVIVAMGAAYSHPRVRWKARPLASAATVFVGQGILGALAGWVAARGGWNSPTLVVLGALAAALTTLGLYPLTQVYQIEEDRRRGDRTLAVALGPARALRFGFACLACAGVAAVAVMAIWYEPLDVGLVASAYGFVLWEVWRFAEDTERGRHTEVTAFRTAMRLNFLTSAGFVVFIALRLIVGG